MRLLIEPALGPDDTMAPVALRKVRQAEEFMRAHFAEPLRVADIADAVGLGARSSEAAFRRALGSAPWARLTSIRLEQARRRLLASGGADSVTAIALECGFTHLGRFAQLYRKAYGELPSDTLRQGR